MKHESLEQVFAEAEVFDSTSPDDFTIIPLAGFTNENYRLFNAQHDWVLRIPRSETDNFIDREAEAHNQELAHRLNIAPQVVWRDSHGTTLTPTLKNSRALCAADFDNEVILPRILAPVQQLHRSGVSFQGRVNLQDLLRQHFDMLSESDQQNFAPRLGQAERVLKLLETEDTDYVASHNDLVLENLLLDDTRLWLIDWEYSAMASPYWDLATLCNTANLNLQQSQRLLQVYATDGLPMEESILFDYRGLLQLLTDCWMNIHAGS